MAYVSKHLLPRDGLLRRREILAVVSRLYEGRSGSFVGALVQGQLAAKGSFACSTVLGLPVEVLRPGKLEVTLFLIRSPLFRSNQKSPLLILFGVRARSYIPNIRGLGHGNDLLSAGVFLQSKLPHASQHLALFELLAVLCFCEPLTLVFEDISVSSFSEWRFHSIIYYLI